MDTNEITFVVTESPDGGYEARAGYSIFTQKETREELKAMGRDAVWCRFEDGEAPRTIYLHLVRDHGKSTLSNPN